MNVLKIVIQWDAELKLWFVKESDLPGLHLEAETQQEMQEMLNEAIPELLASNMPAEKRAHREVPLELLFGKTTRFRVPC